MSKTNDSFFSNEISVLPQNFAQIVMQLQMQLQFQQSSTLQVVQQLNQMYRIAIEYYINEDQRKMVHFQRKLTSLLTHPNTLQVIENRNYQKNSQNKKEESAGTYNKVLKHQINKFNSQSSILVKSMLQGSEMKAINSNRLINKNIENQQQILKRRLESRSKSKSIKIR